MSDARFHVGISSGSFLGMERSQVIQMAGEVGAESLELVCREPHLSLGRARLDRTLIQLELQMQKLRLAALSLDTCFTETDAAIQSRNKVLDFIDLARSYGTSIVGIVTGPPGSEEATLEQWDRLVEHLAPCVARAEKRGIRLAVGTFQGSLVDTIQGALMLLDRFDSSALGLMLDVGDLALANGDVEPGIAQLGDRTFLVRVRNFAPTDAGDAPAWASLGEGVLSYPRILRALLAAGYRGDLILAGDYESTSFPRERLQDDVNYLKRLVSYYVG